MQLTRYYLKSKQNKKLRVILNLMLFLRRCFQEKGKYEHKDYIKIRVIKNWLENMMATQDDGLAYAKNFIFKKLQNTKSIKRDICLERLNRKVTKGVYDEKIRHINATLALVAVLYEKCPDLKEERSDVLLKEIDNIYLKKGGQF